MTAHFTLPTRPTGRRHIVLDGATQAIGVSNSHTVKAVNKGMSILHAEASFITAESERIALRDLEPNLSQMLH